MKPSFILFHAECVNGNHNAICHMIMVPVVDGVRLPAIEFFCNPDAPFLFVQSGTTNAEVQSFPPFADVWPEIQALFGRFDIAVCSAEGYSANALYGTLTRLGVDFEPIKYCNAKTICRRTLNLVSYSFDFLNWTIYHDSIPTDQPVAIAERWCDYALDALIDLEYPSMDDFMAAYRITPGVIAPGDFVPSLIKRDYSGRKANAFDSSAVPVDADPEHPLFGMNVVFTGKLEAMTRNDARSAVISIGGIAPDRLTKETNYLVVGVQDLRVVGEKGLSGKMKTAQKYKADGCDIEIIDENDFLDMLGDVKVPGKKSTEVFLRSFSGRT